MAIHYQYQHTDSATINPSILIVGDYPIRVYRKERSFLRSHLTQIVSVLSIVIDVSSSCSKSSAFDLKQVPQLLYAKPVGEFSV